MSLNSLYVRNNIGYIIVDSIINERICILFFPKGVIYDRRQQNMWIIENIYICNRRQYNLALQFSSVCA